MFWLSTVRRNGRPHVTPLVAVFVDEALWFCTGQDEQKAKNLDRNTSCILTTGCNSLADGLDIVVEGDAHQVSEEARLEPVAAAYNAKYGEPFTFTVRDGAFAGDDGRPALVFEVKPSKVLAFAKGATFSQTRWRFEE